MASAPQEQPSKPPTVPEELGFLWWNLESLIEHGVGKLQKRGPTSGDAYQQKLTRIRDVLAQLLREQSLDLVGLCELTEPAARHLQELLFPRHQLRFYKAGPHQVGPQDLGLAVLYREELGLAEAPPLAVPGTSVRTRPMPIIDLSYEGQQIRFLFGHWPAMDAGEPARNRIATFLGGHGTNGRRGQASGTGTSSASTCTTAPGAL